MVWIPKIEIDGRWVYYPLENYTTADEALAWAVKQDIDKRTAYGAEMIRSWKLWLDDQVNDPETPARHAPVGYFAADSFETAKALVLVHGFPELMDLDHDLGNGGDAMMFLRWMEWEYPDRMPPEYQIHSENPIGRDNIVSFMESWKKSRWT